MGDIQSDVATPMRNPNQSKWDLLFDKKTVEWISFKPQLGLCVYPCYACRHMFSSKNSFLDHVNRRALVLHYKCTACPQELTFYNPCSFLLHTRQHFTLLGGQICLDNLRVSILPFGLGGFLPDPSVPSLYNDDEDDIGESSTINTRFYSPTHQSMGQPVITLIPNEVLFLFVMESSGNLSSLVLKQTSSTIPKCKFITMESDRLNPIPAGVDIYGRELASDNEANILEPIVEIKQEPEDVEETSNQYSGPIITKIETVKEKESYPKCPECEEVVRDQSMPNHFLDANIPSQEDLKCIVCKYIAPTKCSLQAHERVHEKIPPHVCPECGKIFSDVDLFESHLDEVCFHLSKQVRLKCPGKKCGKVFAQILKFKTHFATHMRCLFKCQFCDAIFLTETEHFEHARLAHNANVTGVPVYNCSVCNEIFNGDSFLDHLHVHATSNKKQCVYVYICKHCRSSFRSISTYTTHLLRCVKLARTQAQHLGGIPVIEKPKKKPGLYVLGTCSSCKTQIKAQVPKVDNMPDNCPNCWSPLKSNNENMLFIEETDNGVSCVLCQSILDPSEMESHFNSDRCKYFKPSIPLRPVDVTPPDSSGFKKKRRRTWTTPLSKQKRLSLSFEAEPVVLDDIEPTPFDGTYHCKLCSFTSGDRKEFHWHIVQHRSISTAYQCMECGECFVVKPSLEKHLVYYHQIDDINSYFNENECVDKQAVKELEDVMHLTPGESKIVAPNQCRVCLQQFGDPNELNKHFRTHGMAFILNKSQ